MADESGWIATPLDHPVASAGGATPTDSGWIETPLDHPVAPATAIPAVSAREWRARDPSITERIADYIGVHPSFITDRLPRPSRSESSDASAQSETNFNLSGVPRWLKPVAKGFLAPAAELNKPYGDSSGVPYWLKQMYYGFQDPGKGIGQALQHGSAYAASGFGYTPNPVSNFMYDTARANDEALAKERSAQNVEGGYAASDINIPRLVGDISNPINYIGGARVGAAAGELARAATPILKSTIAGTVRGSTAGAVIGATQPVYVNPLTKDGDYGANKTSQIETGAIAGPIAEGAGNVIGRIVSPILGTSEQKLVDAGIETTPMQKMGPWGRRLEDAMSSFWGTGELVNDARKAALHSLNIVSLRRPLDIIGVKAPKDLAVGHDGYTYVADQLGNEFNRIYSSVGARFRPGALSGPNIMQLGRDLIDIRNTAIAKLPTEHAVNVVRVLNNDVIQRMEYSAAKNNGVVPGEELRGIMSDLKEQARSLGQDPNIRHKNEGFFIHKMVEAIDDRIGRISQPLQARMERANVAYGHLMVLNDAVGSSASTNGVFSPAVLNQAAVRNDPSGGHLAARGRSFYQDISNPAKEVIESPKMRSTSPERFQVVAGTGAVLTGRPEVAAALAAPSVAVGAVYNPVSRWLMNRALTGGQSTRAPIANVIRQYGSRAAVPLAIAAQQQPSTDLMDQWQRTRQ